MENSTNTNERENKLLRPSNDIVFQSLFTKKNSKITKAFVSALIGEKIHKVTINDDKELFRNNPDEKLGILDLQVDADNDKKIDVEVQMINKHNLEERMLFYFSKMVNEQIQIGEDYSKLKKIIIIAILDYEFKITKEEEKSISEWMIRETKNPQKILTSKLEFRIIELRKVMNEYKKNSNNKLLQWLLFLDDPNKEEVKEIMKENEDVNEAMVEIHEMSEDEKIRRLADLRQKARLDEKAIRSAGMEEGIKQGEEKGMEQKQKEIIISMLSKKMDDNTIIEITKVNEQKLKKIKEEVKEIKQS